MAMAPTMRNPGITFLGSLSSQNPMKRACRTRATIMFTRSRVSQSTNMRHLLCPRGPIWIREPPSRNLPFGHPLFLREDYSIVYMSSTL